MIENTILTATYPVTGAGLGLRRELTAELSHFPKNIHFMEIAPENWAGLGGRFAKELNTFTERYPFVCHGLSLSLGGPKPLDTDLLATIKGFIHQHKIRCYSEHLSYCTDDAGHLYDLLPIPFTEEAVHYVANRIKQVQDYLEQTIAIENVSYYAAPGKELDEITFINAILAEADCELLLDINNIYINSINHGYNAETFLLSLPADRIAYAHVAGHYQENKNLIIDTHGASVIPPVWDLLSTAYQHFGIFPTLLERDFNFPGAAELLEEVDMIHQLQSRASIAK